MYPSCTRQVTVMCPSCNNVIIIITHRINFADVFDYQTALMRHTMNEINPWELLLYHVRGIGTAVNNDQIHSVWSNVPACPIKLLLLYLHYKL